MTSVSSEDDVSDRQSSRCDASYCLSADISESETSSTFSLLRSDDAAASTSTSLASSPVTAAAATVSFTFPTVGGRESRDVVCWDDIIRSRPGSDNLSEVETMKERFGKLLLGEDMSGGGKGVCTALAISNAITNLAASVFGELWRLEPLAPERKKMWCRQMEWFLCVSESIVELVPSVQDFPGGRTFEVMATRPRSDLYVNLPALKKLDAMLVSMLEGFKDTEFWYIDRESDDRELVQMATCSSGQPSVRQEDKWWLPCPKVPDSGLSEEARKRLQQCRDCTNQILKAAMAINSSVIAEMEIPYAYLESLPKNGKDCLGEIIYRYITADQFSAECLLDCIDLSSEHQILEVVNRIEAAVHIWRLKDRRRHVSHSRRPSWGGKVKGLVSDIEKNYVLAHRAETLLRSLKLRFPILPQTALDMAKIQYNKDVGHAILESYSRVTESLAFNIMARIDDLLFVDDATKESASESRSLFCRSGLGGLPIQKRMSPSPFSIHHSRYGSPFATPSFCLTPANGSPERSPSTPTKLNSKSSEDVKPEKDLTDDFERIWSHPGNLSARKNSGDAPERD